MESPLGGTDSRVIRTTPSHYIVRMAEGLLYVSAVRSNENFLLFICFIARFEFGSITGHFSFVLNRAAESGSGPGRQSFSPPPSTARVDLLKSLHKTGNVERGFGLKGLICTGQATDNDTAEKHTNIRNFRTAGPL